MRTLTLAGITLAAFTLAGCFSDSASSGGDESDGGGGPVTPPAPAFKPIYAPLGGILPYPTDLYFNGSTDGTLNIPLLTANPTAAAMNTLDGFSTTAPITIRFSAAIDPASLNQGSVKVFEVVADPARNFATVGFQAPLLYGVDYTAGVAANVDTGGSTLRIDPLRPLNQKSAYLVVLTDAITDAAGTAAVPDSDYALIKSALPSCSSITNPSLNGICQLVGANVAIATNPALGPLATAPEDIVLTFSFSTQMISDTLAVVASEATARPTFVNPLVLGTTQELASPSLPGVANVQVGSITLPYYSDPTEPLTTQWIAREAPAVPSLDQESRLLTRYNPRPLQRAEVTVPMLVTVPNACEKPETGWPVVIYQHGITTNRTTLLAMADALAAPKPAPLPNVCFVAVAIDLPLHGVIDTANPLFASAQNPLYNSATITEQHFNLDVVDNTTGAPPPDGLIDPSGLQFINLQSLPTTRANAYQGVANLLNLAKSVGSLDLDADGTPDTDPTRVEFFGWSLGAMAGITFLGVSDDAYSATLAYPGGVVSELLIESASFAPVINGGLAAAGVPTGTTLYYDFLRSFQALVDAADPINYGAAAAAGHPVLMFEIVGSDSSLPDQTIPNSATERLIDVMGLPAITATTGPDPAGVSGIVRFNQGDHGTIASPAASPQATIEQQTELAAYTATQGSLILISDPSVIAPAP
jgi:hypothetical protein